VGWRLGRPLMVEASSHWSLELLLLSSSCADATSRLWRTVGLWGPVTLGWGSLSSDLRPVRTPPQILVDLRSCPAGEAGSWVKERGGNLPGRPFLAHDLQVLLRSTRRAE